MLHIYAALAENERSMISERTKDALAKANSAVSFSAIPASARWSPKPPARDADLRILEASSWT
jgi:DNA invertase Pin-like site-specific DNA recombinase